MDRKIPEDKPERLPYSATSLPEPIRLGQSIHATCVAIEGRGLLILGPSGAGKSSLALSLMAFGAGLVADDLTRVDAAPDGQPVARSANPDVPGIELRGYGIVPLPGCGPVPLRAVLDLSRVEPDRFPRSRREIEVCGRFLPLLFRLEGPQFPAAVMVLMRGLDEWLEGRSE